MRSNANRPSILLPPLSPNIEGLGQECGLRLHLNRPFWLLKTTS
jgi:hypothetical protein